MLTLLPAAVVAQTVPDWTVRDPSAFGVAVAVDGANNTLVVGSAAAPSMQLTKVDPSGVTLWQRDAGPAAVLARSTSVGVGAGGQVLVTGFVPGATGSSLGAVVSKFDALGNLLWQDATPAAAVSAIKGLLDSAGNAYVLLNQPAADPATGSEIALAKYNAAGLREWTRTWGARFTTGADAMVLTPAGQVVVAGVAAAPVFPATASVAAFDAAGNTVWATSLASDANPALAVSATGDIALVGAQGPDFMVARFNASFAPLWVRTYPARGLALRAAFDPAGNLIVSGVTDVNTGTQTVVVYTWMTIKVDAAGNALWTHLLGSSQVIGGEVPAALDVAADGAAYITGQSRVALASGLVASSVTTVKLSAAGALVWRADSSDAIGGVSLKLGSDGGVRVLGNLTQVLFRYPQSGLPNVPPIAVAAASPSAGPAPLTVQFSAAGSSDPDGLISGYFWDFGDGQSSTLANPSHVYAAGQYVARLTVTDVLGATAAASPVAVSSNAVVAVARPTALRLSRSEVTGGRSVIATVRLSNRAGATLSLSSSNPAVAQVPATIVVPPGATSATFTITTSPVRRDTRVAIAAAANGAQASAVLKVERR